jgi:hypothetical protein
LKADLQQLCAYYGGFPAAEKEQGLGGFARYPPREGEYVITRLWDKHLPAWRQKKEPKVPDELLRAVQESGLIDHIKKFDAARPLEAPEIRTSKGERTPWVRMDSASSFQAASSKMRRGLVFDSLRSESET